MAEELQQAQEIYELILSYLVAYGFQLLGALLVFLIGIFIAGKLAAALNSFLTGKNIDVTLSRFASSTLKVIMIVMVAVISLGQVGISITPLVAAIGALGLGAGLAVQGLLSNYGAGISIIVARPFVVGDTIAVNGVSGIVQEIKLGYTILTNEDEVIITIPNRHIIGEILHNSHECTLLELSVGIAYDCNPGKAIEVISQALQTLPGLSQQKPLQIGVERFGDSSIDIGIRCWVKTEVLFETKYQANMLIHQTLAEHKITIPFPQRDVHLFPQEPVNS